MNTQKKKKLEAKGWKVGSVEEFLDLSPKEYLFTTKGVGSHINSRKEEINEEIPRREGSDPASTYKAFTKSSRLAD